MTALAPDPSTGEHYAMSEMTLDLAGNGLLAVTKDALAALRNALMRDSGHAAAGYFQEAGYAGGAALFEAFRDWLEQRDAVSPESLPVEEFQQLAAEFFREAGWGSLTLGTLSPIRERGLATVLGLNPLPQGEVVRA